MANSVTDDSAKALRYLLDEDISPNIVAPLWEDMIDAVPLRDRARLRLPDFKVVEFAIKEGRAVVTNNLFDFERIVKRLANHPGVVAIPSGGSRDEQREYIVKVSEWARGMPHAMNALSNRIVSIDEDHSVAARYCCAGPVGVTLPFPSRAS